MGNYIMIDYLSPAYHGMFQDGRQGQEENKDWYLELKKIGKLKQTPSMVKEAVENSDSRRMILEVCSKKYLTRPLCRLAVNRNPDNIKYVPEKYCDYDMCRLGVEKNGHNLGYVPRKYHDHDLCMEAVRNDGDALRHVPPELMTYEMCETAVKNDRTGHALGYVPGRFLEGEQGYQLCSSAIKANGSSLRYVPENLITEKMARDAVANPVPGYGYPVAYVPSRFITAELADFSLLHSPCSFVSLPERYKTKKRFRQAVQEDPACLQYFPEKFNGDKAFINSVIDPVLEKDPRNLNYLPPQYRTPERCLDAMKKDPSVPPSLIPGDVKEELEKTIRLPGEKPEIPEIPAREADITEAADPCLTAHSLEDDNGLAETIYYVTDIHLEHQLPLQGKTLYDAERMIKEKVSELVSSASDNSCMLLAGGDVACSFFLWKLFFGILREYWQGPVVAVLGNHELWEGDSGTGPAAMPLDDVIRKYRESSGQGVFLLENDLLLICENHVCIRVDEKQIMDIPAEELAGMCHKASSIILGGTGFSGRNLKYNSANGLYRSVVPRPEDISRSERFEAIYAKLIECAGHLPVMVLTHNPVSDWSGTGYHPGWIYVNGHTHTNNYILMDDGTAVFSDNQTGYGPKRWKLNSFTKIRNFYDPLSGLPDGIHGISLDQYREFNRGRGIFMSDMKYPGDISVLKRKDMYMFVLRYNGSLYLLDGGKRKKLGKDIRYYYDNLLRYCDKIQDFFRPYMDVLDAVSRDVRRFGGRGDIHGCIVDIDSYNHIYLNLYDGTVTPYFAWNTEQKQPYPDVISLLENSPVRPAFPDGTYLSGRYREELEKGSLTSLVPAGKENAVPGKSLEWGSDKSIYGPSRIVKSVQYMEKNVVRIWADALLDAGDREKRIEFSDQKH